MVQLLLAIIYLAFISLGLPDSLLGAAWPIHAARSWARRVSYAGIVSMIIAAGHGRVQPAKRPADPRAWARAG